jgi:hypothetical protein
MEGNMNFLNKTANNSGSHPPIVSAQKLPPGCAIVPTQELYDLFYQYNGFVIPTYSEDGLTVTDFQPNTEAWEAWNAEQAALPPPEPTQQDDTNAMLIDHEYRLTLIELGV